MSDERASGPANLGSLVTLAQHANGTKPMDVNLKIDPNNIATILMYCYGANEMADECYKQGRMVSYKAYARFSDQLRNRALRLLRAEGIEEITPTMWAKAGVLSKAFHDLHRLTLKKTIAEAKRFVERVQDEAAAKGFPQLKFGKNVEPWMFYETEELREQARIKYEADLDAAKKPN